MSTEKQPMSVLGGRSSNISHGWFRDNLLWTIAMIFMVSASSIVYSLTMCAAKSFGFAVLIPANSGSCGLS